jgi:hypothetical protein
MAEITYTEWHSLTYRRWRKDSPAWNTLDRCFHKFDDPVGDKQKQLGDLAKAFSTWQLTKPGHQLDGNDFGGIGQQRLEKEYLVTSMRNKRHGGHGKGPMERLAKLIANHKQTNLGIKLDAFGIAKTNTDFDVIGRSTWQNNVFDKSTNARIEEALRRVREAVDLVLDEVRQANRPGAARTRYEEWFGTYDQNRFKQVRERWMALRDVVENANFEFVDKHWKSYFAATVPGHKTSRDTIEIDLGKGFFKKGAYEISSGATVGTLIHELTHACFYTYDMYLKKDRSDYRNDEEASLGAEDLCNDPDNDKDLATHFPEAALENADNYGEYAKAVLVAHGK